MKESIENCKCIEKLMIIGKVEPYSGYTELSNYAPEDVELGTLCFAQDVVRDDGEWDGYQWVANITINRELFPINYCPIYGKEIKYQKIKELKL